MTKETVTPEPDASGVEDTLAQRELREEFLLFRDAAAALETAYQELKERASGVDRDLADANQALQTLLSDRESILGQLPIGVFRIDSEQLLPQNPAAFTLARQVSTDALRSWLVEQPAGVWHERGLPRPGANPLELRALRVELEGPGEMLWFVEDQTMLRALRDQVARLDRLGSLAELSLGVAHEVLNPLNGVKGFASLLRRNPESPKAAAWAEHIDEGVARIHRIVRELLDFARPERRSEPCRRSLAQWLEEAAREAGDMQLEVLTPELELDGSPEALGQVFANLVRNAREAGASNIRFEGRPLDATTKLLRIEDDGPGIPEEIRSKIFDPFCGTKESGSGLGLAFCARALQEMGAEIRLSSPASGASFELSFRGGAA